MVVVAALGTLACDDSVTAPDDGEEGNFTPVQAIDKADDVADQVEQKAKDTEEEINRQLDQLP
jgi:hypothetical protein